MGSVLVMHGLSCLTACGIFPYQESNLCVLHWQVDSWPLSHQGSPLLLCLGDFFFCMCVSIVVFCFVLIVPMRFWYSNLYMYKVPFFHFNMWDIYIYIYGHPWWLSGKESACSAGVPGVAGLIPGSGRSPEEGNCNPLQYSCLENSLDRGAWWATVLGIAKNQTQLSDWAHLPSYMCINISYLIPFLSLQFLEIG